MLTTHNAMHPQAEVDRLWLSEVQACVPPPPDPHGPRAFAICFLEKLQMARGGAGPSYKNPMVGLKNRLQMPHPGTTNRVF